MQYEEVRLGADAGAPITAWFVPAGEHPESAGTILFCHGNAGNIGDRCGSLATFHGMGLNVLIFDYQGYGTSAGRPTEEGTYRDARLAWDHLVTVRGIPASRIVLFGRSLGGSVAAAVAAAARPAALAVESTFFSAPDMARHMFPLLPMRALCRFNYDTGKAISFARCPVLIAHSRDDEMIPFEQGKRLFDAAPQPKKFVELRGGHNYTGLDGDPAYRQVFRRFVEESLAGSFDAAGRNGNGQN
jgi:fermentation-respiration switch protein FrsA (DUF1100 family)